MSKTNRTEILLFSGDNLLKAVTFSEVIGIVRPCLIPKMLDWRQLFTITKDNPPWDTTGLLMHPSHLFGNAYFQAAIQKVSMKNA